MRFTPSRCPHCRGDAIKIDETLAVTADLSRDKDGSYDYGGDTEVYWDCQEVEEDDFGRVTLYCEEGHTWKATAAWGDAEKNPRPHRKTTKAKPGSVTALADALREIRATFLVTLATGAPDDHYSEIPQRELRAYVKKLDAALAPFEPKPKATVREALQQMSQQVQS